MDTKTEELAAAHMASGFVPSVAKWLAEEGAPVIGTDGVSRWYEERRAKRAEMSRGAVSPGKTA